MKLYDVLTMRLPTAVSRLVLFVLFLGSLALGAAVLHNPHPCVTPLEYSIGRFDKQFGLERSEFRSLLSEAEAVWEDELESELFRYNPDADFHVNLIFDERQKRSEAAGRIRDELNQLASSHEEALRQYRALKQRLEELRPAYNRLRDEYEQKLATYNNDVSRWNERGGAPPDKREELEGRRVELSEMRDNLQQRTDTINAVTNKINRIAEQNQSIVREYESTRNTFSQQFGGGREFEQGQATGSEINIYQYNTKKDLRLVLAHELGHALGITHVEQPTALMYYLMKDQQLDPIKLTEADREALARVCSEAGRFDFLPF